METEAWKRVSWGMFCECERDGCLANVFLMFSVVANICRYSAKADVFVPVSAPR